MPEPFTVQKWVARDGSALDAVVVARVQEAFGDFDKADWFWRDLDPDDCGDNPQEAVHRSMLGNFTVCHIRSSFTGPSKFCFTAPVLDPASDDEECLCFDTQDEAIAAANERRATLAKLDGGAGMTRTITLKDGRVVEVNTWLGHVTKWWRACPGNHDSPIGTGPTEAAAIAALKRKLEEQQ